MDRRHFLALSATALAGCSADPAEETPTLTPADVPRDQPTETSTDSPASEMPDTPLEGTRIVDYETVPRTLTLPGFARGEDRARIEVQSFERATADRPARLRVRLTNENDWANTFRLREVPFFQEVPMGRRIERYPDNVDRPHGEENIYFAPTENHDLTDEAPEYERHDAGFWITPGVPPKLPPTVRLDAGESIMGEYSVLGHWEWERFPTGRFRVGYDEHPTLAIWDTRFPGVSPDTRFENTTVPDLPNGGGGEGSTWWYHETTRDRPVYLSPITSDYRDETPETVTQRGRVRLNLVNHSREALGGNRYSWGIYKLDEGEWFQIEPWVVPAPYSEVPPGDEHEYSFSVFHGEAVPCEDDDASIGYLGGGTYAVEASYTREDQPTAAALFALDARNVEVTPEPEADIEYDGSTATVTFPSWDRENAGISMMVERADETDAERIIPEQTYRRPFQALRNVLPVFDSPSDVESVRLREDDGRIERFVGYDAKTRTFSYEGETYVAEVE